MRKKERERNAFLKIGKGTRTERDPHFTKISIALGSDKPGLATLRMYLLYTRVIDFCFCFVLTTHLKQCLQCNRLQLLITSTKM